MKAIPHILSKVYCEPWVIAVEKHRAIRAALAAHMAGDTQASAPFGDRTTETDHPYIRAGNGVALIQVSGILGKRLDWFESMCGGYDVDTLVAALGAAVSDPSVRSILIDWDTPGGVVTGIPEAGEAIVAADKRKPVVSFTETECYSGGIWLATQARQFYATQSAGVGSIGVYLAFLDESASLEAEGLKINAISAGKYKLSGASFRPMTEDERAMFQARVDRIHGQFKEAVKSGRPGMTDVYMEGQMFDGGQAAEIGLTDGIVAGLADVVSLVRSIR